MNRLPGKCPVLVCLSLSRSAWGSCNADLSINKILSNILFFAPTSGQWQQMLPVKKTIKKSIFFTF